MEVAHEAFPRFLTTEWTQWFGISKAIVPMCL